MIKVLITGVGSEGALGVIRSLREAWPDVFIIGLDTNAATAHRNFTDEFVVPPLRSSPGYIPFVATLLKEHTCDVLWPIPTDELEMFAAARADIESDTGCRVMIGSLESISVANDKVRLYQHLSSHGIDVIAPFKVATDIQTLDAAVAALGYPSVPVVIKPARGAGSQGFRILDPALERRREYFRRLSLQQRVLWEDLRPVFACDGVFPEMLVTEYLPGAEWDVDILAMEGKVLTAVTRESHSMFGGMATDAEVHENSMAKAAAVQIAASLGLSFVHNIAFRCNSEGKLRLLEINPRVPGTIIAATRAGVNIPALAVELLLHGQIESSIPPPSPIRLVRYWDEVVLQ